MDGRDVEEIVKHGRILSEVERAEVDAKAVEGKAAAGELPPPEPPAAPQA